MHCPLVSLGHYAVTTDTARHEAGNTMPSRGEMGLGKGTSLDGDGRCSVFFSLSLSENRGLIGTRNLLSALFCSLEYQTIVRLPV